MLPNMILKTREKCVVATFASYVTCICPNVSCRILYVCYGCELHQHLTKAHPCDNWDF